MDFNSFVRELRNIEGLEDLEANREGIYSLKINDVHFIYFSGSPQGEDLFLYATVCQIPDNDEQRAALYDCLLSANLFGRDSGNGWFAKDSQFNQILLISRISLHDLSLPLFTSELKQMVGTLSHWTEVIKHLNVKSLKPSLADEKSNFFIKI
jgi:hypothetical protein